MGGPGGGPQPACPGGISRPGTLRDLSVLPDDHAGRHAAGVSILRVYRNPARRTAAYKARHRDWRGLFRDVEPEPLSQKQDQAAAIVDQARISGRAGSALDLHRIRYV